MVGVVISSKMATLIELQTVYSYEDMAQLYEVIVVNNYNEYKSYKEVTK